VASAVKSATHQHFHLGVPRPDAGTSSCSVAEASGCPPWPVNRDVFTVPAACGAEDRGVQGWAGHWVYRLDVTAPG
jgi:hypothetical protein